MLKITGGNLKSRSINVNSGLTTRPTGSKVREALFNIIGNNIIDSNWLDLFGGSGIIGIEALSRNAEKATFTEIDYPAFNLLKKNLISLNIQEKAHLIKGDAVRFLNDCSDSFDFIYLDPPYASDLYIKVFSIINEKPHLLKDEGVLIVEHKSRMSLPDLSFTNTKSYKYGDTTLSIYRNN